jgi:hypothetical protein
MKRIKSYDGYIAEKLLLKDDNLKAALTSYAKSPENMERIRSNAKSIIGVRWEAAADILKEMGYSDYLIDGKDIRKALDREDVDGVVKVLLDDEIKTQISLSKRGRLGRYLEERGGAFTFGMLKAIFLDAKEAKLAMDVKKAGWQMIPRALPLLLAPFYPTLAIIGLVFGTSRTFNKILKPLMSRIDSDSKYTDFLKSFVEYYMRIPEGEVSVKDRFSRAFVVTDRLIDALKQEVVDAFTKSLIAKMSEEPEDMPVPDHYVENELKKYLNDNFDVDPNIPLKD